MILDKSEILQLIRDWKISTENKSIFRNALDNPSSSPYVHNAIKDVMFACNKLGTLSKFQAEQRLLAIAMSAELLLNKQLMAGTLTQVWHPHLHGWHGWLTLLGSLGAEREAIGLDPFSLTRNVSPENLYRTLVDWTAYSRQITYQPDGKANIFKYIKDLESVVLAITKETFTCEISHFDIRQHLVDRLEVTLTNLTPRSYNVRLNWYLARPDRQSLFGIEHCLHEGRRIAAIKQPNGLAPEDSYLQIALAA